MENIYTEKENKANNKYSLVPDVTGFFVEDGVRILESFGYETEILSCNGRDDSIIILHEPMGGDYVKEGSLIEIVAE